MDSSLLLFATSTVSTLTSLATIVYTVTKLRQIRREEEEERVKEIVLNMLESGMMDRHIKDVIEEVVDDKLVRKIDEINANIEKLRLILCTNIPELKRSDLCR